MSVYVRKVEQGWRVCVEDKRTGYVDWPIRYENGKVAYDNPYRLTKSDKRLVEKTFRAMHSGYKWSIWEWELMPDMGGNSFEDRCRFTLAGVSNASWPHKRFAKLAEKLEYDEWREDTTLIGGYFVNPSGDSLVVCPGYSTPWELCEL